MREKFNPDLKLGKIGDEPEYVFAQILYAPACGSGAPPTMPLSSRPPGNLYSLGCRHR